MGLYKTLRGESVIKFDSEVTANVSFLKDEEDQGFKIAVTLQVKRTWD